MVDKIPYGEGGFISTYGRKFYDPGDFDAKTADDAAKEALTNIAMQVAAMNPQYISRNDISADELAKKEDALFVEESADLEIELEETGIYTLIAVGLDADGNTHGYKSYEISYVKADDERPVILNIGIGSAGKYVPKGFSTDNTVEIYAYGEEISDMKIAVVQAADLNANLDKCIKTLMSSKSVADETLKLINSEGYAGPVTGLLPGTEYYLIAYASNGYEYRYFVSEESVLTTGEPVKTTAKIGEVKLRDGFNAIL